MLYVCFSTKCIQKIWTHKGKAFHKKTFSRGEAAVEWNGGRLKGKSVGEKEQKKPAE